MPSQRNRSCRQKPPNGALKGVIFPITQYDSFERPVLWHAPPHGGNPRVDEGGGDVIEGKIRNI
jgi:hypothetical protein